VSKHLIGKKRTKKHTSLEKTLKENRDGTVTLTRKMTEITPTDATIRFPMFLGYFVNDNTELLVSVWVSVFADTSSITANLIFVDESSTWIRECRRHRITRRRLIQSIRCGTR
jgi:hypothetical protein